LIPDYETDSADLTVAAPVAAPSFRVMSYNVRYVTSDDKSKWSWKERKKSVLNRINTHNPDIIALQEVETTGAEKYLRKALTTNYSVFDGPTNESKLTFYRKGRFERVPDKRGALKLPSKSGECDKDRTVDWIVLFDLATSKEVLVLNAHFENGDACDSVRMKSAETINSFLLGRSKAQVIVLGDLNVNSNADPKKTDDKTVKKLTQSPKAPSLVDYDYNFNTLDTPTYNGAWKGSCKEGCKRRLDYMFYSGTTLSASGYTVDTALNSKGITPSDHHPVIATFTPVP
jgi:endonuclease/exonuclease/phosphatase family metal-dependent hydrolase